MSTKDTLMSVGLLAAGGVAIAAASGAYGKGSRAKHRSSQDVYRQGRMPALDPNEFPAIPGMQGPFRYASGEVLYYDPREGKYYDRRRDMYVEHPSKGSMTRDGSYEATLMYDADEDDPRRRSQQALADNPYVPQARPLTAEPQRITSAQGSPARMSSVLRGATAKGGTSIPGPSLKTLDDRLNLGGEEGKSLKYFMQAGQRKAALDYADELLGGNGIEYIASEQDTMRSREGIEYVNTGDTYNTTLIYDYKTGRFYVGAWGDWVERYPKRFGY